MKKSLKKASLSLSINAVVILVLAIAMLGLGLGFTKKMFGKFGDTIQIPEPELSATESDPIVTNGNTINLKAGKSVDVPFKYYSTTSGPIYVYPFIDCPFDDAVGISESMNQGEQKLFRMLLKDSEILDTANTETEAICSVKFCKAVAANGNPSANPCTGTDTVLDSKQVSVVVTG